MDRRGARRRPLAHRLARERDVVLRARRRVPDSRPGRPAPDLRLAALRDLRRQGQPRPVRPSARGHRGGRLRAGVRAAPPHRPGHRPALPQIRPVRQRRVPPAPGASARQRRRLAVRTGPRLRRGAPRGAARRSRDTPGRAAHLRARLGDRRRHVAGTPGPVLHLPQRLRGAHLPALPPGADVPPHPRAGRRAVPGARPGVRVRRRRFHVTARLRHRARLRTG